MISSEEEKKAIDCAIQHIKTYRKQAIADEKAYFGAPCEECKYGKECDLKWYSILEPLMNKSSIQIRLLL